MKTRFLFVIRRLDQPDDALETVWVSAMGVADLGVRFEAEVRRLGYDPEKLAYRQMIWIDTAGARSQRQVAPIHSPALGPRVDLEVRHRGARSLFPTQSILAAHHQ
jgi:hypothetical protein